MSQDNRFRATGYVVGSNKGGQEWVVKIQDCPDNFRGCIGRKIFVKSIDIGVKLRPGLSVSFDVVYQSFWSDNSTNILAYNVTASPQAEVRQRPQYDPAKRGLQSSFNLIVVENLGDCNVIPTQAISYEEAKRDYEETGTAMERVTHFICIDVPEELDGALAALSALVWMNISDDEGFGRVMEEVLTQVYKAGRKQL